MSSSFGTYGLLLLLLDRIDDLGDEASCGAGGLIVVVDPVCEDGEVALWVLCRDGLLLGLNELVACRALINAF